MSEGADEVVAPGGALPASTMLPIGFLGASRISFGVVFFAGDGASVVFSGNIAHQLGAKPIAAAIVGWYDGPAQRDDGYGTIENVGDVNFGWRMRYSAPPLLGQGISFAWIAVR